MRFLTVVVVAGLLACASRDEGSSASPVVGGYFDESAGPTVGIFRCSGACAFTPYLNAEEICSGTLIGPNLVLTARHCVAPQVNADNGVLCSKTTFGPTYPADNFIVTPAKDVLAGGPWFIASAVAVDGKDGDLVCGSDVATLQLRQSYLGAKPMVPRIIGAPAAKEKYSAIGYGDDLDGGLGYRHRRDDLSIQCVGSDCKLVGIDHASLIAPDEFLGETGLCGGDSGGPAVDESGLLLGVTSRANATDCTLPVYSRVDTHAAWLQSQAVAAASAGNYALPAWAFAALPQDGGAEAGGFDASFSFDAGQGDSGSPAGYEPVGGCNSTGAPADGLGFGAALLVLLRFARKGSKFSS